MELQPNFSNLRIIAYKAVAYKKKRVVKFSESLSE